MAGRAFLDRLSMATKGIHTPGHDLLIEMLIDHRRKAGMTQTDVAKAIGRHQSMISSIESGQRQVDVLELLDLAAAMGFSASEFVARLSEAAVKAP